MMFRNVRGRNFAGVSREHGQASCKLSPEYPDGIFRNSKSFKIHESAFSGQH